MSSYFKPRRSVASPPVSTPDSLPRSPSLGFSIARAPGVVASSAVPNPSGSGEYAGGLFESSNLILGPSVGCVKVVDGLCKGLIGAGSKFCLRMQHECFIKLAF